MHTPTIETISERKKVQRCIVFKKSDEDVRGKDLTRKIRHFLDIDVRHIQTGIRYDGEYEEGDFSKAQRAVFGEAPVDDVYEGEIPIKMMENNFSLIIESRPGQYDPRADMAEQSVQVVTGGSRPKIKTAEIYIFEGNITEEDKGLIKKYLINPVEKREGKMELPETLDEKYPKPEDSKILDGFRECLLEELRGFMKQYDLAMTVEDIQNVQNYFREQQRDPTVTELKVIDMYWSDHCRHTTFTTELVDIMWKGKKVVERGKFLLRDEDMGEEPALRTLKMYGEERKEVHGEKIEVKNMSLMDLALHSMRIAQKRGLLNDMEQTTENNAASIIVPVEFEDGHTEDYLFMFKNETHNFPTDIEPFGGAATCLGGVIRDPLSGRSVVFMGMRVSGGGDPTVSIEETLKGKLPQIVIAQGASDGYRSYGNQIGLPTGKTEEYYHSGFRAKRLEAGCVGGAVKKEWVRREDPKPGDVVILLGGRTGRDGIDGATGSSKSLTETSLDTCGAKVQKGGPVTERHIQKMFGREEVIRMIKKCNDFGAGGVANAVGELADGLTINLDAVPKKYEGLNGTELAISESQERMAVVVSAENAEMFIKLAEEENLESTVIAHVKEERTLTMKWRDKIICDMGRDFLEGGWAKREANVDLSTAIQSTTYFQTLPAEIPSDASVAKQWETHLQRLSICSREGLQLGFDSMVGGNTVMAPYGGKNQVTPNEAVVSRFPIDGAITAMANAVGYDPDLAMESPYLAGMYSIIQSLSHLVATGVDWTRARLTLQNYFEKLGNDPHRWGKVLAAQLGAKETAMQCKTPAIGGKDSMSGTFINEETGERIDVPPTLISFAVAPIDSRHVGLNFFQKTKSKVVYMKAPVDPIKNVPDWEKLTKCWNTIHYLIQNKEALSCHSIGKGGVSGAVSEMCFGNGIGIDMSHAQFSSVDLFTPQYGSFVLEFPEDADVDVLLQGTDYEVLGSTQEAQEINLPHKETLSLPDISEKWRIVLDDVYMRKIDESGEKEPIPSLGSRLLAKGSRGVKSIPLVKEGKTSEVVVSAPRALIVTFPGTNCERETRRSFEKAGALCHDIAIKNLKPHLLQESIDQFVLEMKNSQLLVFPGGFSAGDEPDGSAKFSSNILRNPRVRDELERFKERGGLILGICNGAQTIIKSKIQEGPADILQVWDPTLTFNTIGKYICRLTYHKVISTLSPWMLHFNPGDVFQLPIAHGEGRFIAPTDVIRNLWESGRVAVQYVNEEGNPSYSFEANPNGSLDAIAAVTDVRGQILWLMAHPERFTDEEQCVNVPGERRGRDIIQGGVDYFTGHRGTVVA